MSWPLTPKSQILISPREFTRILEGFTSKSKPKQQVHIQNFYKTLHALLIVQVLSTDKHMYCILIMLNEMLLIILYCTWSISHTKLVVQVMSKPRSTWSTKRPKSTKAVSTNNPNLLLDIFPSRTSSLPHTVYKINWKITNFLLDRGQFLPDQINFYWICLSPTETAGGLWNRQHE